ncbi:outer membrane beta-barrel protein [Vibrio sp. CK2-1]|uniref:outer membrane beta-barrel protein n=1 Tax=Vibrio sp. CK2-1 TaxID=2912249 RepID=UPI001F351EA4|nr:outer membrane beta-barrel protein [Vibrio sp. CK2-1]MCF7352697.1 porin family protein [Vibrio sp. CK2-1]
MMRKTFIYSGLLGILVSPVTLANNLEPHMYMGLLYSYMNVDIEGKANNQPYSDDFDNSLVGLSVGYQFHKFFALEGRGYGGVSDDEVFGYTTKIENHFNIIGKGIIPIDEQYFKIYGMIGYGYSKLKIATESESDSDILYGVGLSVSNNKPISLDIEWIRAYDDDSTTTVGGVRYDENLQGDMFNLNLVYHFK